jgi:diadenosine tetraphosphate (Ap4A) HIT family hydrolase
MRKRARLFRGPGEDDAQAFRNLVFRRYFSRSPVMKQFQQDNRENTVVSDEVACRFCNLDESPAIISNDHATAIYDGFPVTPGHTLIVPKRHIASFFEATSEEQAAMFDLLAEMRQLLLLSPHPCFGNAGTVPVPDGFNIGINDGMAAGQTVMHLHIHLIPRFRGDTEDPRGGVRWIMPVKAPYWKKGNCAGLTSGKQT